MLRPPEVLVQLSYRPSDGIWVTLGAVDWNWSVAINAYPDPNGGTVNEWHVAACSDRYFVGMPYASSEMVVYDTNYRLIESVAEPI